MSAAGSLLRVALWVIANHLQQAQILNTPQRRRVWPGLKRSLRPFYRFPHLGASLLWLIADQGAASRTRPQAAGAQLGGGSWLGDRPAALWGRGVKVLRCWFRETSPSRWRLHSPERVAEYGFSCLLGSAPLLRQVSSSSVLDAEYLQNNLANC